jgi:hypothetical protein
MKRLALLILLCSAAPAFADGLPLVDYGVRPDGITAADGSVRYATLGAGRAGTVVARIAPGSGRVQRSRVLAGRWAVPAVAYDGTAGGLAADGSTLALIRPRVAFPRKRTALVLLDEKLRVRSRIDLRGDFSFDAIAPDGSALFLVEYPNRRNPGVYRVRVYDVAAGRLLAEPLLDSRVATVVMRGLPVTRQSDGETAYTLYDGFGDPFIHALDTVKRSALCILLPDVPNQIDPTTLDLRLDGTALTVGVYGNPVEVVDTVTNAARPPAAGWPLGVLQALV